MAWRSQGSTGSNALPLGNRRRFGGDEQASPPPPPRDDGGYNPSKPAISEGGYKRGRSPVRGLLPLSHDPLPVSNAT